MKLTCHTCRVEISRELTELKDLKLLNTDDGQDYIPEGYYLIDDQTADLELDSAIVVNIKDLINSGYHSNPSRLNGCCGNDGLDGMNRVCINNHEIGTEKTDCWMFHFVSLNPDRVDFS